MKFPHPSLPPYGAHVCEAVLSDLTDFLGALIRPLPPSADPTLGAPARPPDADGGGPNGVARLGRGRAFPSFAASSPPFLSGPRSSAPPSVGGTVKRARCHPSLLRRSVFICKESRTIRGFHNQCFIFLTPCTSCSPLPDIKTIKQGQKAIFAACSNFSSSEDTDRHSGNVASASVRAEEREEKRGREGRGRCSCVVIVEIAAGRGRRGGEGEEAAVGSSLALIGRCSSSVPRGRAILPEQILRGSLLYSALQSGYCPRPRQFSRRPFGDHNAQVVNLPRSRLQSSVPKCTLPKMRLA